MRLKKHFLLCALLGFSACSGGIETDLSVSASGVQAPSLAAIYAALQASNAQGMVVGAQLSDIVLPAFTDGGTDISASTCYTVADLPSWLEFDSLNHTIRLADGQTAVPTDASAALTVTYSCTIDDESDSVSFVLNDMDGGGLVDQAESTNVLPPVVSRAGTLPVDAGTENFLLMNVAGVATFPSALTTASQGFDPADATDDSADFDGDGISNDTDDNVFVAASSADFSTSTMIGVGDYRMPEVADYDGDGNLDIAVTEQTLGEIGIFLGNGDGTFTTVQSYSVTFEPLDLLAVDFDNDGDLDLLLSSEGTSDNVSLSLLRNDGDGTFAANEVLANGNFGDTTYIAVADFDADGDYDLAQSSGDNTAFDILLNDGTGAVSAGQDLSTGQFPGLPEVADFNHDGFADLVLSQLMDANSSLFFGDGAADFSLQGSISVALASASPALGDINNDGHIDIVYNSATTAVLQTRLGNGEGLFEVRDDQATDDVVGVHLLADFNGDGALDVLAVENDSTQIELFTGDNTGTFTSSAIYPVTDDLFFPAPGDFDNDGDIDFVVPYSATDVLRYFENQ